MYTQVRLCVASVSMCDTGGRALQYVAVWCYVLHKMLQYGVMCCRRSQDRMYLKKSAKKNKSVQVSVVGDRELMCVEHVTEEEETTNAQKKTENEMR